MITLITYVLYMSRMYTMQTGTKNDDISTKHWYVRQNMNHEHFHVVYNV